MRGGQLRQPIPRHLDLADGRSTKSQYPYCRKYTTGIFSGFDCWSQPSQVEPLVATPIDGYSTLDFSSTRTTTTVIATKISSSSSGSQHSSNVPALQTGGTISATPFSETQRTASIGGTTAATVSPSSSWADQLVRNAPLLAALVSVVVIKGLLINV